MERLALISRIIAGIIYFGVFITLIILGWKAVLELRPELLGNFFK